ncbi:ABC transporter substrate-binding protein [Nocardia amikacinitolerans]|uniref:ABC transporter substrate-binding protein n=1 Tax=Nocardia amikacinitolerans TaxID=756689 RepID=UPI0020A3DA3F|nr:ABC transporter substrate-binding protein [Nocardia amikacinitolerans]MCP2291059.1 peptide/nickel transport system substrate-binding protein [Nocardia amikacinitolerans]
MGFNRRQLLRSGAGVGALLFVAACTDNADPSGPARRGGTLRVGALGTAARIERDPHANLSNDSDFLIASLVYDALTVPGDKPNTVARLASSWESDAAQRRWAFTIAEGATFHDGAPVTADDVVWSLRRLRSVGGASKMPVAAEGITADGSNRVVLTVPEPNTQLPLLVRLMTFTVRKDTTDFTKAIGTGPFRLESFQGGNARLVRNENWHGAGAEPRLPLLDAIEVTMFESVTALGNAVLGGQIDLASNVGAIAGRTAEGRGDLRVVRRANDTMLGVAMRAADGPFADPRVRAAVRLGVDRKALVDQVHSGYGTIANDILGTADPTYDSSIPQRTRDIERAKTLLREANFDTGRSYPLVTKPEAPGEVESAKVIATQLADIGLRLDVVEQESNAFYDRTWLQAPLYTVSWGTNDSTIFYASKLMSSASNRNETAFKDAEFDAATTAALAAADPAELEKSSRRVQAIQHERGGYLVWGMADGIDVATSAVRDLPTLGGFGRVQLERVWLA